MQKKATTKEALTVAQAASILQRMATLTELSMALGNYPCAAGCIGECRQRLNELETICINKHKEINGKESTNQLPQEGNTSSPVP